MYELLSNYSAFKLLQYTAV